MEEDLKDIDLIDRYLNGELDDEQQQAFKNRFLSDPQFKNEVEAYQKIYEGIEKAGREALKQRLEGYYNEYADEDLSIEPDHKVVPINKWGGYRLVISGIAASVLLLAFGLWYYTLKNAGTNQQIAQSPNHSKIGSGSRQGTYAGTKDHPATSPGKQNPATLPANKGDEYSLTDGGKVNSVEVLSAAAAAPLAYTFNGGILSIYNAPALGLIRLHVFRAAGQYNLWYDGDVYRLEPAASAKTLTKTGQSEDFGIRTAETIKVQVEPLQASASPSDALSVRLQKAREGRYFFRREKDKLILELQGDFSPAGCKVIDLQTLPRQWFLITKDAVYALDEKITSPKTLKALSALASREARLFIKREPVVVPVYARK